MIPQYPADWIAQFGPAVWRDLRVPNGGTATIPPHPDRYVLVILGGQGVVALQPGTGLDQTDSSAFLSSTGVALSLNYRDHGPIVAMGWTLFNTGGVLSVCVIEAFARRPSGVLDLPGIGSIVHAPADRFGERSASSVPGRFGPSAGADTLLRRCRERRRPFRIGAWPEQE